MKKDKLEQQLAEAIAVSQRLGIENKQLREASEKLTIENNQLRNELDTAIERVRSLAGQVNMLDSQNKAKTQYSDSDRNY